MFREVLLALVASSLLTPFVNAQAGGAAHGTVSGTSARPANLGLRGASNGTFAGRTGHRRTYRSFGSPYFLPDYFASASESYEPEKPPPEPFPRVLDQRPEPEKPALNAQFIEIPGAANLKDSRNLAPTVFILTNGERLQCERFLLTSHSLSVSVGRQQREIPLEGVDLAATVAANRERGVNLHVPADHNEISLGF